MATVKPKRIDTRKGYRGTPTHTVRVADDIWTTAIACTAANGTTVSDVVRDALIAYNRENSVAS